MQHSRPSDIVLYLHKTCEYGCYKQANWCLDHLAPHASKLAGTGIILNMRTLCRYWRQQTIHHPASAEVIRKICILAKQITGVSDQAVFDTLTDEIPEAHSPHRPDSTRQEKFLPWLHAEFLKAGLPVENIRMPTALQNLHLQPKTEPRHTDFPNLSDFNIHNVRQLPNLTETNPQGADINAILKHNRAPLPYSSIQVERAARFLYHRNDVCEIEKNWLAIAALESAVEKVTHAVDYWSGIVLQRIAETTGDSSPTSCYTHHNQMVRDRADLLLRTPLIDLDGRMRWLELPAIMVAYTLHTWKDYVDTYQIQSQERRTQFGSQFETIPLESYARNWLTQASKLQIHKHYDAPAAKRTQ